MAGASLAPGAFSTLLRQLAAAPTPTATRDEPLFRPGRVIGRFELVREIGRGGFGVVYEAKDRELGRTVALKAVLRSGAPDVREERLLREAEAAARLAHPNIVTLHDVGRCDQGPYLVLELLHGQTLASRLEQGRLPLREALRVAVEVAKGLAHAHAQGVVHRDLTPGNIFICDEGQVKVLDFGMAHAFGRRKLDGGTEAYMAPEQLAGAPEDERTDVFALGVVLYRMVTGELPFAHRGAREDESTAATLEVPDEPALGDLVMRMLEKSPLKRPRDGGEVLGTLTALQREVERSPTSSSSSVRTQRRAFLLSKRKTRITVALAALGVLIGAGTWYALWRHRRAQEAVRIATSVASVPSIAVLPFADMSPQHDQEYFADGIAEEILSALGQVEGLHVAGRTSSFFFKGKNADLAEIGRKLDVATVLEGSVRKDGNRVRIHAQLVRVHDGHRVWSQSYERELSHIFALQDEIARAAVDALRVRLVSGTAPSIRPTRPTSSEAYNEYFVGRQLENQESREGLKRAAAAYEKALAIDPSFAPAAAQLASVRYELADISETAVDRAEGRKQALAFADMAVALDPQLATAYAIRAYLRLDTSRDWQGAKTDIDRAVALNPGDERSQHTLGLVLAALGKLPDAIIAMRKAAEIDPLRPMYWWVLSFMQSAAGRLEEARAAASKSIEIAPGEAHGARNLGFAYLLEGRHAEAAAAFERSPFRAYRLLGQALVEHSLGHATSSARALEDLIANYSHGQAYQIAEAYAWRGENDHAFAWLERAYSQQDSGLAEYVKYDPLLRKLRADSRYTALLQKMKLPLD